MAVVSIRISFPIWRVWSPSSQIGPKRPARHHDDTPRYRAPAAAAKIRCTAAIWRSSLCQLLRLRPMSNEVTGADVEPINFRCPGNCFDVLQGFCGLDHHQTNHLIIGPLHTLPGVLSVGRLPANAAAAAVHTDKRPAASASSYVLTMGTMTPYAPASRTRKYTLASSWGGVRIGTASELPIAWIQAD